MKNNILRFSIIMPSYNRKVQLIEALKILSNQKYDFDLFEIIVIDDGSIDGTSDAVSSFKIKSLMDINLIFQKNKGPAHARNTGIKLSKHEYLIFLDSDCYPLSQDWLYMIDNKINKLHSKGFSDFLLSGRISMPNNLLSQRFIIALDGYGTPDFGESYFEKTDDFISFPTTNLIIPKTTFNLIGGFDENIIFGSGEDTDFCYRLWKSGKAVFVYEPSIQIFHLHRTGFNDMVKLSFRRSINHHTLLKKYGLWSKRCFRRRLNKIIGFYGGIIILVNIALTNMSLAASILGFFYFLLVLIFLIRSKSSFDSLLFPIYYLSVSFFEVLGSTIAIWIFLRKSYRFLSFLR